MASLDRERVFMPGGLITDLSYVRLREFRNRNAIASCSKLREHLITMVSFRDNFKYVQLNHDASTVHQLFKQSHRCAARY
jgi:hypothetical protein